MTVLAEDYVFEVDEARKNKLLAVFLAFDAPVRPSPFLLGDVSPGHEAGAFRFWAEIEHDLLEHWISEHPGTRPAPWYWWRAPEPMRRQVGGTGESTSTGFIPYSPFAAPGVSMRNPDMKAVTPDLPDFQGCWRGLALAWRGVDPADPAVVESEAAYLKRHRLLTAAEARRLRPEDFEPVVLEVGADGRLLFGDMVRA